MFGIFEKWWHWAIVIVIWGITYEFTGMGRGIFTIYAYAIGGLIVLVFYKISKAYSKRFDKKELEPSNEDGKIRNVGKVTSKNKKK